MFDEPAFFENYQMGEEWTGALRIKPQKDDGFLLRKTFSLPLWKRILAWCHYAQWYGPEDYELFDQNSTGADYDNVGELHIPPFPDHFRHGFAFPPASETAIREAELIMGFAHPPLLRDLYLHVANGGFGPGKGLTGVPGGYCYWTFWDPRYTHLHEELFAKGLMCNVKDPVDFAPLPFDLERHEQTYPHARLIRLAVRERPTHCLHLCAGEYVEEFYVHAKSGYVYMMEPANGETLSGKPSVTNLYRQADSLEEWFERWLDGDLEYVYPRE